MSQRQGGGSPFRSARSTGLAGWAEAEQLVGRAPGPYLEGRGGAGGVPSWAGLLSSAVGTWASVIPPLYRPQREVGAALA